MQPWSAEQVRQWRARNPAVSPWYPVMVQALVALLTSLLAAGWFGWRSPVAVSVAYGGLAAWLPAALFAHVAARRMRMPVHAAGALMALMVWEGIKVVLTIALLLAAPKLVAQLNWLALLAGFVVTIKAAWVALWRMALRRASAARLA